VKRDIGDACLNGDPEIARRFAFAADGWAAAVAGRGIDCPQPWADEDWSELRDFNASHGAPAETLAQIDRLRDPAARVAVTGQQAGLALGPLFTLYKALGAILLARKIEEETGVPVVPCFWIAAEDHDFEEVATVSWLSMSGEIESFQYQPANSVNGVSVGDVTIKPSLFDLIERLEATTAETEFRPQVIAWLRDGLENGGDLEGFFARVLLGLLGKYGLVALTPRLMGLRCQALSLFKKEIEQPGRLSKLVIESGNALEESGFQAALHRQPEDLNFFFYEDGKRCKLLWDNNKIALRIGDETVRTAAPGELLKEAEEDPRRLSCNVVTRPMCQDLALPTLGYIAGPGEIAYFAQLREAYETSGVFMPVIAPRPRAVLLDSRTKRFLAKAETTVEEFLKLTHAEFESRLAAKQDSSGGLQKLNELRQSLSESINGFRQQTADASPAVSKAIEKLAAGQDKGLRAIEQRMEREIAEQNQALLSQWQKAETWLRPHKKPQERVFSALAPLLVNYGMDAVDGLLRQIDPDQAEPQVIDLG
jgi:bacillithiol biosynthesis cysteine-adding enzyme BshC